MKYLVVLLSLILSMNTFGEEKKVATVNGKKISQEWIDHVQEKNKKNPNIINLFLRNVITEEMIAQEAEKIGLQKDKDFKIIAEVAARKELADYYMRKKMADLKIDDAMLKAEYDKIVKGLGKQEYKLSQIVLKSEEDAAKAIAELKKNKFADVANKYSTAVNKKKPNGGVLGWVNEGLLEKDVLLELMKLKKGEFNSKPIKSKDNYFVVLLEDSRPFKAPEMEKVKQRLVKKITTDYRNKIIKSIRDKSEIKVQ